MILNLEVGAKADNDARQGKSAMNSIRAPILLVAMAVSVGLLAAPAIADSEGDVARAERKAELRKIARDIFNRANERAKIAVRNSSTGKKNNETTLKAIDECMAQANRLIEASKKDGVLTATRRALLDEAGRYLALGHGTCMGSAIKRNPNNEIIAELRDEFIKEELERLRDTMKEAERKNSKLKSGNSQSSVR